jgi:hypothetical protein
VTDLTPVILLRNARRIDRSRDPDFQRPTKDPEHEQADVGGAAAIAYRDTNKRFTTLDAENPPHGSGVGLKATAASISNQFWLLMYVTLSSITSSSSSVVSLYGKLTEMTVHVIALSLG